MTELEPIREVAGEVTTTTLEVAGELSPLGQWAADARQAHLVATSLAATSFVPQAMKGKASEITGAILTGAEMGLQPMASIRSINIIQGTPALSALALRGLVQSRGHELWVESSSESRVVICGKRKGSEQVQKSVWTIDRAKRLGLTSRDNWMKQPEAMLVARATSEVCRLVAADVLLGLPYSVEELADENAAKAPKSRAKRAPVEPDAPELAAPADEPAEAEPVVAEPDEPDWSGVALPGGGVSD